MQHIGLVRESETGDELAAFDAAGIDLRIVTRASGFTSCLRFIDPYGDTIFNQLQIPVLLSELEDLRAQSKVMDLRENIDRVVDFLRQSQDVHAYARFVGD